MVKIGKIKALDTITCKHKQSELQMCSYIRMQKVQPQIALCVYEVKIQKSA